MGVPVSIESVEVFKNVVLIHWADGWVSRLPGIFLRDNCPCCRHANGQKLLETSSLFLQVAPKSCIFNEQVQTLTIVWADDSHTSTYSSAWLWHYSRAGEIEGAGRHTNTTGEQPTLWNSQLNTVLPAGDYNEVSHNAAALANWLSLVIKYGFAVLRKVSAEPGMVMSVIKLFGYARETNYGKLFDVKTVVNPNNLAYTDFGISPHTDNPYREPVPGLQLLHCLASTATGGESILVDGFKVADDLSRLYPHYFYMLRTTPVTFCFRDKDNWLQRTATIIESDILGKVTAINFNNRSIQPFSLDEDALQGFYEAYLAFARMLDDKKYQVQFKMEHGDLYIVNNRRVLHARNAFSNNEGERWLQGAYADIDSLTSKWRVLNGR